MVYRNSKSPKQANTEFLFLNLNINNNYLSKNSRCYIKFRSSFGDLRRNQYGNGIFLFTALT
jgi:hypothetical protein